MGFSLRPVGPDDYAFLFQVYASTRAEEMEGLPWEAEQKQAFLQMQFNAQKQSYEQQFPEAHYQIILRDGVDIGRLIVDRAADGCILLMDIALLPEHRNAGIGSSLIKDLQIEAGRTERPLRLHVESFNPAIHLYERLGFKKISESSFYWLMEWRADPASSLG